MKKIVFLLVAAIAAGAVSAQKPFTFGPKVGINVTDLHPDGLDDINHLSGTKPALVIGAFAEYRAAKWFAVSLDVLYSRQGSSAEITQGALGSEHKLKFNNRLNYLNIPILANFYVTNGLALKAGIQPAQRQIQGKSRRRLLEYRRHEALFQIDRLLDPGRHLLHVRTRSGHRRPLQYPGHRHRDG
mgnify:CR=1 FL=1